MTPDELKKGIEQVIESNRQHLEAEGNRVCSSVLAPVKLAAARKLKKDLRALFERADLPEDVQAQIATEIHCGVGAAIVAMEYSPTLGAYLKSAEHQAPPIYIDASKKPEGTN